jgi:hypothetical protein
LGGQIFSWNIAAGTMSVDQPTTNALFAIFGPSVTEVYAAGAASTLLKWNGAAWTQVINPAFDPSSSFLGLAGGKVSGVTEVWIVGGSQIWRGDGTNFSLLPLPSGLSAAQSFVASWWNASNDVWIAGGNATLLHWDGTRFTSIELADTAVKGQGVDAIEILQGVWSSGPGDAWVVGSNGGIWHFTGTTPVRRLASGTQVPLYGVHGNVLPSGDVDVAFVGGQGTILRYRP